MAEDDSNSCAKFLSGFNMATPRSNVRSSQSAHRSCLHRQLALFLGNRNAQRALAARRSSIKSRSTSQYLSAERRSLSIPSASADPLSSGISGRHCAEGLLDLCRVRFDLEILQRLRCRAASINIPPSWILSVGVFASRCWNGCANHLGGSRSHSYPD
jgi:hypothetical protein